jgi:hypothetical protein
MIVVSFITAMGDEWPYANAIPIASGAIASGAIGLWWPLGGDLRLLL